ncbi:heparinase II/III family protein [Flavicella sp.]|uniref:heparinase II/III domain-containing protein n=1 Tax=Flavicella sp. TaxID=2957742 RepID=UPI00301A55E6
MYNYALLKVTNKYFYFLLLVFVSFSGFSKSQNDKLSSKQQTKTANVNDTIHYAFQLKNTSNTSQIFYLKVKNTRQLACENLLRDTEVSLMPNKIYNGILSVVISDRMAIGGVESSCIILENEEKRELESLEFISVRSKSHPFLLVTNEIIEEAKEKIKNYDWAQQNLNNMLHELDRFEFPERKIIIKPRPTKVWSSLNYKASDGEKAFQLGLAYKLTGKVAYRDKLIALIKAVCDKDEGYLSIGAVTNGVQVHEGNFFLFLAAACDLVFDEETLSDVDRENIENTFRFYLKLNKKHMSGLGIMNHQASANAGAIVSALFLQDIAEVEFLTDAEGGMADQISKGVMADGWWFEGTANYCYLVTQRYTLVAQAFQNYGWDLYHRRFPVKFKSKDFDNVKEGFAGMKFDNWGPTGSNTRGLEDMVSPYIPFMDENAYVVASNDSNLKEPNEFYEFAYRAYKNNDLAWVISKSKRDSWGSLMYGVAELPKVDDPRTDSALASNVGLVALRSQGKHQEPKNQIQAFFKFGTHGGWHGHFDRASMVGLGRNGHKYFGTEMVWYGYGNPGYKECVQTSATHNMIIVDELQQEAVPSKQTLFYKGDMMQVTVVETNARWKKIPKWNAEKFPPWDETSYDANFQPVLQKRLSILTDDYMVIADFMKSNKKHDYDWLIHPVGLQSNNGLKAQGALLGQLSTKTDSPYKYFENAQWYIMNKGSKIKFNEEGNKLDIYTLWPKKAKAVIANYPNGGKQRTVRNNPDRRTYGVRVHKKEAAFLHVIEPYKGDSMIVKIKSKSASELVVYLKDGRKQVITISNLESTTVDIMVSVIEYSDGEIIREEKTNK